MRSLFNRKSITYCKRLSTLRTKFSVEVARDLCFGPSVPGQTIASILQTGILTILIQYIAFQSNFVLSILLANDRMHYNLLTGLNQEMLSIYCRIHSTLRAQLEIDCRCM